MISSHGLALVAMLAFFPSPTGAFGPGLAPLRSRVSVGSAAGRGTCTFGELTTRGKAGPLGVTPSKGRGQEVSAPSMVLAMPGMQRSTGAITIEEVAPSDVATIKE